MTRGLGQPARAVSTMRTQGLATSDGREDGTICLKPGTMAVGPKYLK